MIYEYEACVLKHINKAIPEVRLATYAKEPTMFGSLARVKEMPSFLYYREPENWDFPHMFDVVSYEGRSVGFSKFEQKYIGRIYVATNAMAFKASRDLRFYWSNHAYVYVPWDNQYIKVALRLLYIKVDQDRSVTDKKGPENYVEFSWSSQIFMDNADWNNQTALVEEVHIYLDEEGSHVLVDDNLIATIK